MDIREERKRRGWSRQELARKAGIDRSVLQLLELDQSNDDESRAKVLAVLGEGSDGAEAEADADA